MMWGRCQRDALGALAHAGSSQRLQTGRGAFLRCFHRHDKAGGNHLLRSASVDGSLVGVEGETPASAADVFGVVQPADENILHCNRFRKLSMRHDSPQKCAPCNKSGIESVGQSNDFPWPSTTSGYPFVIKRTFQTVVRFVLGALTIAAAIAVMAFMSGQPIEGDE